MKFLKLLFFGLIVLGISSCGDDADLEDTLSNVNIELREIHEDVCFMTYNTFLLDTPDIGAGPQCEGALCVEDALAICASIGEQMPEVVHLQEVFANEAAYALMECLQGLGYNVEFDDTNNQTFIGTGLGSGLMTASLFPMSNTQVIEFDETTSIFNQGNDGAADKGFMINQIELEPGCFITSINTHTDAGSDPASRCTRMLQFLQMNEYIQSTPSDIPVLLGGDLNLDANGGEEIAISSYFSILNYLLGNQPGNLIANLFNNNCIEFANHPEFQEEFIGALEFQVLLQLMKGDPVHLISGDQLEPTASGEQVLDYFILSNMTDAFSNIETQTLECDPYRVWYVDYCYNDPDTGLEQCDTSPAYFTEEEADTAYENCQQIGIYSCRIWWTDVCDNPSDHDPVITCFDYDCTEQLTNVPDDSGDGNGNPPNNYNCKPPCGNGEECIDGNCVPI